MKQSDLILPISISLISYKSNYSVELRSFGLHFLEHALLTRWNTWTPQQQLDFRNTLVSLLLDNLSPTGPEKRLIKEKMASLIVGIALRMWPQNWPDFRSFLEGLFNASVFNLIEIALMVVRSFAEDIFIYELKHVDEARLHELKAALLAEAPFLLTLVSNYMKGLANQLSGPHLEAQARSPLEAVLIDGVQAWAAYLDWVPFQYAPVGPVPARPLAYPCVGL